MAPCSCLSRSGCHSSDSWSTSSSSTDSSPLPTRHHHTKFSSKGCRTHNHRHTESSSMDSSSVHSEPDSDARPRGRRWICVAKCVGIALSLLGILLLVGYLVLKPRPFRYSIDNVQVVAQHNDSMTKAAAAQLLPEFQITMQSEKPVNHIDVCYADNIFVALSYSGTIFHEGMLLVNDMSFDNVPSFVVAATGAQLPPDICEKMKHDAENRMVQLEIILKTVVNFKVGSLVTKTAHLRIICDFAVDGLDNTSKLVSNSGCQVR